MWDEGLSSSGVVAQSQTPGYHDAALPGPDVSPSFLPWTLPC